MFHTNPVDRNDVLKVIACLSMLIDHIGYGFFPGVMIFRIIGRIAFPIFAYHVAIGVIHTRNINKYMLRLFLFGVISQIPYSLFFYNKPNIFFTLLLGIMAIDCYRNNRPLSTLVIGVAAQILNVSYGIYGVMLIFIFYIFREDQARTVTHTLLLTWTYVLLTGYHFQIYSIFALLLIYMQHLPKAILNRYVFYSFYPVHIMVLFIIKKLL